MKAQKILKLVEEIDPIEVVDDEENPETAEQDDDVVFNVTPTVATVKEGSPLAKYVNKAIRIAKTTLNRPFKLLSIATNSPEFGLYSFLIEPVAYILNRSEMILVVKELDYNAEFKVWGNLNNAIRIGVNEKTEPQQ